MMRIKKENEEKELHLRDVVKEISCFVMYDDIRDAHYQSEFTLYEDMDDEESIEEWWLSFTDKQFLEISDEEFSKATSFDVLDRMAKLDRTRLSNKQLNILKEKYKEKIIISREDVIKLLESFRKCNRIFYGWYNKKTDSFMRKNNLSLDDCLFIIKNLKLSDYVANTTSYSRYNARNNLIIFEPKDVKLKDGRDLGGIVVYVKLDIDDSSGDVVAMMTMHDALGRNSRPYKDELEESKKKKKKQSSGWSWFERVKIPAGDETIPIAQFNNSVNYGGVTPDGGNLVTGGMGVGESLEEQNEEPRDIETILAIHLQDKLLEHKKLKDDLKDLERRYYSLIRAKKEPAPYLLPTIKEKRKQLEKVDLEITKAIPSNLTINYLLTTLIKLMEYGTKQGLVDRELKEIENVARINDLTYKKPRIGQEFKFYSFNPTRYIVKKVDDNLVYYDVYGNSSTRYSLPIEEFDQHRKDGIIRYI